jgi:hypothetical protein
MAHTFHIERKAGGNIMNFPSLDFLVETFIEPGDPEFSRVLLNIAKDNEFSGFKPAAKKNATDEDLRQYNQAWSKYINETVIPRLDGLLK